MHTRELYRLIVDTNVINNNNIATHNLWLRDDNLLNKRDYPYHPIWTRVQQPCDNPAPISLHLDALNPAYYFTGEVIATLDDDLYQAWYDGGMLGSGFLPLDSQRIQITDVHAVLENIYSDSCHIGNIGLEFFPLDTNSIPTDTSFFTLSQVNEETGEYHGGVIMQIDFNIPEEEEGGGDVGGEGEPFKTMGIKSEEKSDGYFVYPNPANSILNIQMSLSKQADHQIEITDLSGKVLSKKELKIERAGNNIYQIDISKFAEGAYLVKIVSQQKIHMEKFSIIR